jgi:hypothetical protein
VDLVEVDQAVVIVVEGQVVVIVVVIVVGVLEDLDQDHIGQAELEEYHQKEFSQGLSIIEMMGMHSC